MSTKRTKQRRSRAATNTAMPTRPEPAPLSDEWFYLSGLVCFLRETILKVGGGRDALAKVPKVDAAAQPGQDIETPEDAVPAADLLDAIDEFYALPESDRRTMLGGWGLDRWPPYRQLLAEEPTGRQPSLVIRAGGRQGNGAAWADQHLTREDSTAAVHLHVRVGSTRREVIQGLWDLLHLVETQWGTLTTANPLKAGDAPLPVPPTSLTMVRGDGPDRDAAFGTENDPSFLSTLELLRTGVAAEVLLRQLKEYGAADQGDHDYMESAETAIRHAVTNGINFNIEFEVDRQFEAWEQDRGTLGKERRWTNTPDAQQSPAA